MNYFPKMANTVKMWFETGIITSTIDKCRFVPVHSICAAVGPHFCNIRPAIHSLRGSDSVLSLSGIGKKTVFNVVTQKAVDYLMALTTLGTSNKEAALSAARAFTAMLYDPRGTEKSSIQPQPFTIKAGQQERQVSAKLPSSEASLEDVGRRAQWQRKVWMSSHVTKPNIGPWVGKKKGRLVPVYCKGPMAS